MSFFKKIFTADDAAAAVDDSSAFGLTLDQLNALTQLQGKELMEKLNSSDYNGINGILEKLKVDKNIGLDSQNQQDLELRRRVYGKNQIPHKPLSFLDSLLDSNERKIHRARDEFEKAERTTVIRDNRIQEIPLIELVVGDLCPLKSGEDLPADGLIVEASDVKVDESSMTGESELIKKNENEDAALFAGTKVMEGNGRMVVIGVGPNSLIGRIFDLVNPK